MRSLIPHLLLSLSIAGSALSAPPAKGAKAADFEADVLGADIIAGLVSETTTTLAATSTVSGDTEETGLATQSNDGGPTKFNSIDVPPLKEINGTNFKGEVGEGYWYYMHSKMSGSLLTRVRFIKHYSPYCQHCIDIAPTWQTLYEFYYVSLYDGNPLYHDLI